MIFDLIIMVWKVPCVCGGLEAKWVGVFQMDKLDMNVIIMESSLGVVMIYVVLEAHPSHCHKTSAWQY